MSLQTLLDTHIASAIDLRHRLHRIPETMYEEFKTAAALRVELDRLKIPHVDGVDGAPTATIAQIGDSRKPCIALRADIDALPIEEKTGLPYASTHPGNMHACGHDGHSATLIAAAGALSEMADDLPVCVKFLFQPAEEGGAGAEKLVKAGTLDGRIGPKVQAIFGLHGWPGLPVGSVSTKPGPLLAATDTFSAIFVGSGCHAAYPHLGTDPIVAAAEAVLNLQQCVSRDLDPTEPAVVTIGIMRAGTATNVIPDEARIEGTARSLSDGARKTLKRRIEQRCAAIAAASKCTLKYKWTDGYPATVNDPGMTDYLTTIARQTVGNEHFIPAKTPSMGGEDFAYYLQQTPGCFFLVGVEPPGRGGYPSLHSDRYDFTDDAIEVGLQIYVNLARNFKI